ncbi:MAG TPA: radical SAM protein [Ktedonobacteraceae bacterium]|nr:radical SAM protein [Ktedonobacteraceae bacterium]
MTVELRPLGVACNIACHYCYQNPQREAKNFRQTYSMERMKSAIAREGGPFTLFGGEPLLLPLADLEELLRWGKQEYGRSGIQTNGILLNEEHLRLFKIYNVDVGVSIDGPGELNDLRWHVSLERTRRNTDLIMANIERLCREYRPPGLIVTLHRLNATAERLPILHSWVRQLDALGIRSMRLHLLEVENEHIRQAYSLSDEANVQALLSFADLQSELHSLRFDVLEEMEQSLLGHDQNSSCVWHACDPYATEAVHGVEGNGQSSNCGRTNKDGIDFIKAEKTGYERYIALYQTPQECGGCQGCRFFLMCKGQCPGTAIQGDWRNRSELCGVWKQVFTHLEKKLGEQKQRPLSLHPQRPCIELRMFQHWVSGYNTPLSLLKEESLANDDPTNRDLFAQKPGFFLPPFLRQTFVGEAQRSKWAPRIAAVRTMLARLSVLAVRDNLVPLSLVTVSPGEVFTLHNLAATYDLRTRLLSDELQKGFVTMVVGAEQITARYQQAWQEKDETLQDTLMEVPVCCQNAHRQWRQAGHNDPTWQLVANGQPNQQIDISCSPVMNILLRQLGIALPDYLPCHLHCEESTRRSSALLALGHEVAAGEEIHWLEEMLNWPAEWSTLHGVAELKTGIVKLAYESDFFEQKHTIRYHGVTLASDAARGLSFAYQNPQGRPFPSRKTGEKVGKHAHLPLSHSETTVEKN